MQPFWIHGGRCLTAWSCWTVPKVQMDLQKLEAINALQGYYFPWIESTLKICWIYDMNFLKATTPRSPFLVQEKHNGSSSFYKYKVDLSTWLQFWYHSISILICSPFLNSQIHRVPCWLGKGCWRSGGWGRKFGSCLSMSKGWGTPRDAQYGVSFWMFDSSLLCNLIVQEWNLMPDDMDVCFFVCIFWGFHLAHVLISFPIW